MKSFFVLVAILLGVLLVGTVAASIVSDMRATDDFVSLCTQMDGRALIYSYGADLCVDKDGRIVITR